MYSPREYCLLVAAAAVAEIGGGAAQRRADSQRFLPFDYALFSPLPPFHAVSACAFALWARRNLRQPWHMRGMQAFLQSIVLSLRDIDGRPEGLVSRHSCCRCYYSLRLATRRRLQTLSAVQENASSSRPTLLVEEDKSAGVAVGGTSLFRLASQRSHAAWEVVGAYIKSHTGLKLAREDLHRLTSY